MSTQTRSDVNLRDYLGRPAKLAASSLLAVTLLCGVQAAPADPPATPQTPDQAKRPTTLVTELRAITSEIQRKSSKPDLKEADLAKELQEFDALLAKHKDEKTDEVAQILVMKAVVYFRELDDAAKGTELINRLKSDFPDTKVAKNADNIMASLKSTAEAKRIQATLAVGAPFPDFQETDLGGKPLSLAQYKGKVILIDFWATWCGPCIAELPNVLKAYEKHHGKGFEIVGISLDQSKEKLTSFIAAKNMTWPQFFDGKGWKNKLAGKYGIKSIPATYLLDGEGKILAKNLRGDALEAAVAKALSGK